MNLAAHSNQNSELADLDVFSPDVRELGALVPVTATPAAVAAGVAAGAGVIGAAAGGAALGEAID